MCHFLKVDLKFSAPIVHIAWTCFFMCQFKQSIIKFKYGEVLSELNRNKCT